MIVTKWCVQNYRNQVEGARMVRASIEGGYAWLIRDALDLRYDIAQGTCAAEDLPDDVRLAADVMRGHAYGYVDWPR